MVMMLKKPFLTRKEARGVRLLARVRASELVPDRHQAEDDKDDRDALAQFLHVSLPLVRLPDISEALHEAAERPENAEDNDFGLVSHTTVSDEITIPTGHRGLRIVGIGDTEVPHFLPTINSPLKVLISF